MNPWFILKGNDEVIVVNVFRFNKDELRNCRAIGQVSSSFLAYLNAFL